MRLNEVLRDTSSLLFLADGRLGMERLKFDQSCYKTQRLFQNHRLIMAQVSTIRYPIRYPLHATTVWTSGYSLALGIDKLRNHNTMSIKNNWIFDLCDRFCIF
jgi:hypothetical protein